MRIDPARVELGIDLNQVMEAMAYLTCGKQEAANAKFSGATKIPPKRFSGFEIISREIVHPELGHVLLPAGVMDTPVWPMDVTLASGYSAEGEWKKPRWQFSRVRSLDLREWRGKLTHVRPKMFDVEALVTTADGESIARRWALAPEGADKLREVHYGNIGMAKVDEGDYRVNKGGEFYNTVTLAIGASLRRRYYWSVLISENGGPEARFLTDIAGARAAFRLRDVPEGKRRRAALRHWVMQHWRKSRRGESGDESFVREHLRGATQFTWNGLGCRFEPSDVDARRLEIAKSTKAA